MEPNVVPVNTTEDEVEFEDKNDLLVKRRRTELSGSFVQPQQESEVSDMEDKVPDGLPVEVSTDKDPMDTDCAVQSSGEVNGCSKGHAHGISFKGNESARVRLPKVCNAFGWKEPSFDFEEQGPSHNKLFICKVTLHLEGLVDTVMESFGDPKSKKKAAQEHAAQGALWCLERLGYVF